MNPDIDGSVELVAELDRLSAASEVAARAPRSKALYRYLADGMTGPPRLGEAPEDFQDLSDSSRRSTSSSRQRSLRSSILTGSTGGAASNSPKPATAG